MRLALAAVFCLPLALTGCTLTSTAPSSVSEDVAAQGAAIKGTVHGGQQPVSGAHIYLLAANTTGYGGNGIAAVNCVVPATNCNSSISLLQSETNTTLDNSGGPTSGDYYVTTDAGGGFSITGDYSCTAGQQVYLYVLGGNPGAGPNANIGLMAILGNCGGGTSAFAASIPDLIINEVTTVAAAYALAGFATDATHVSSSGTTLAQTGIANAFATASNLAKLSSGTALATTPTGSGTAPQTTVNTLANILAACINSNGGTTIITSGTISTAPSAPCGTLFSNATIDGTATGTQPTDTASAAINMAHYPGGNVATLYGLQTATSPFQSPLTKQPNDLTVQILYSRYPAGYLTAGTLAIDNKGNVWTNGSGVLHELSAAGQWVSPASGYASAPSGSYSRIVIDNAGYVWANGTTSTYNGSETFISGVTELTSAGVAVTGSPFASSLQSTGQVIGLAVDSLGDIWGSTTSFGVFEVSSGGSLLQQALQPAPDVDTAYSVAADAAGGVWVNGTVPGNPYGGYNCICRLNSSGTITQALPTNRDYRAIAIDNSDNIWALAYGSAGDSSLTLNKITQNGTVNTYGAVQVATGIPTGQDLAIDGAGNVWITILGFTPAAGNIEGFSNTGTLLTPPATNGYILPYQALQVNTIAADGSGNLWLSLAASGPGAIVQVVGVSVPVVTPTATGTKNNTLGTRP